MNPKIQSNFTQVDQTKIHYLSAGKGDAVLLLHGWPTSSYLWRNIMPALSENNLVIAIDLPGFGQSDKPLENAYSFRYYNKIITGFLENLRIEKVSLGVHDLGGPIGLSWAVQNKERVHSLLLMNTLVYPEFSWGVKLFSLASMLPIVKDWMTTPKGISRAMNFGVYQETPLANEIIQAYQAPFQDRNSRKALLKSVQRLSPKGFKEIAQKLPAFDCPVQILYGENDRILPKVKDTMERVKKDLPQAQVTSLPNCGHFLQEDEPEKIGEFLLDFYKQ